MGIRNISNIQLRKNRVSATIPVTTVVENNSANVFLGTLSMVKPLNGEDIEAVLENLADNCALNVRDRAEDDVSVVIEDIDCLELNKNLRKLVVSQGLKFSESDVEDCYNVVKMPAYLNKMKTDFFASQKEKWESVFLGQEQEINIWMAPNMEDFTVCLTYCGSVDRGLELIFNPNDAAKLKNIYGRDTEEQKLNNKPAALELLLSIALQLQKSPKGFHLEKPL